MQQFSFVDELKLRGSYGTVGNQAIGNYRYMATYVANSSGAVFGGVRSTLFSPTRVANPDLKWESSTQADIGIDFSLFERRISGSVEYYSRKSTDLLLDVPLPPSTGFGTKTENVGSMRNSGVELMLSGDIIRNDKLTWTLGGNLATVKNEVLNLGPNNEILIGGVGTVGTAGIIKPGQSIGFLLWI